MLILTRRIGEKTIIGDGDKVPFMDVTVLGVKGNQVRMGFNAPKDIPIHRQEIHERIMAESGQTFQDHDDFEDQEQEQE